MIFDFPKLYILIGVSTFVPLVGFAVSRYFGWGWDVLLATLFIDLLGAYSIFMFLQFWYNEWLDLKARDNKPTLTPFEPKQYRDLGNGGEYALVTTRVQVNIEMLFAQAVMQMWRNSDKIDLTEGYWIKGGRWVAIGGAGRESFVDLLTRWEAAGAIRRKNPAAKNSPYILANRGRVAQAAGGVQL